MASYERRDGISGNNDSYKDAIPAFVPPARYQNNYHIRYTPRNFLERMY